MSELERTVLSMAYSHQDEFWQLLQRVSRSHFRNEERRAIWDKMCELYKDKRNFYPDLLHEDLPTIELSKVVSDAGPFDLRYCDRLISKWRAIQLGLALESARIALSDGKDALEVWQGLAQKADEISADIVPVDDLSLAADVAKVVIEDLYVSMEKRVSPGMPTHIPALDDIIGGLGRSELIILGARPSVGKTAIAQNVVEHAANREKKVLFISAETTAELLTKRALAFHAGLSAHEIVNKPHLIDGSKVKDLSDGIKQVAYETVYYYDPPVVQLSRLPTVCELAKRKLGGLDFIVVDYLQLLRVDSGYSREDEVARVSKSLKALAKQFDCPVLALCQLNRVSADDEPQMYHLRESGQIEQDADVILMMWREEEVGSYRHYLKVAKNKQGPQRAIELYYDAEHLRFREMSLREEENVV